MSAAVPMSVTISFEEPRSPFGSRRLEEPQTNRVQQTGTCSNCPNPLPTVPQTAHGDDPSLCRPCNKVKARH